MNTSLFKKALAILLTTTMVGSFTACGGGTSTDGQTKTNDKEAVTEQETPTDTGNADQPYAGTAVRFSTYVSSDTQLEYMNQYGAEPILAATGIQVEYQVYADRDTLLIEVAGGAGPDILDLDGPTDVIEFINSGKAVELTPYSSEYGWDDLFMDWAYSACYYGDKLYSLPTCYEGMGMYYNTDVMEANGWEIPNTVDELEALMEEIKAAGLVPISFGNSNYQGAVDWLYSTMLSCYGGVDNLTDVLEGRDKLQDNTELVASMQKLVDWWKVGYIDQNSQSITNDDMVARFASGDAVMMIDGTWASGNLIADYAESNWTFELMPAATAGEEAIFPIAIGGCNVINANSEVQDAAAAVLNFVYTSNQDNHYEAIVVSGTQPYPVNWFDPAKLDGMDEKLVHLYDVLDGALDQNNVGYCSWTFYPAQARVYMNENTDSCFLDALSVEDYMANTQVYIDEAIADGTAPQLPDLN